MSIKDPNFNVDETIENNQKGLCDLSTYKDSFFKIRKCVECKIKKCTLLTNNINELACNKNCCSNFIVSQVPELLMHGENCLCSTFGHCYCQGFLKGSVIPSKINSIKSIIKQKPNFSKRLPSHKLCRLILRLMAINSISSNPIYTIPDVIISIMAWGGTSMTRNLNKKIESLMEKDSIEIQNKLKHPQNALQYLLNINGIGLSTATKILFFYDQTNSLFILDLQVCISLKTLFNINIKMDSSTKNNDIIYKNYNKLLKAISEKLKIVPELVEILLWNYANVLNKCNVK